MKHDEEERLMVGKIVQDFVPLGQGVYSFASNLKKSGSNSSKNHPDSQESQPSTADQVLSEKTKQISRELKEIFRLSNFKKMVEDMFRSEYKDIEGCKHNRFRE